MIYKQLFDRFGPDRTVRAGVIGTGEFAAAIVTQSQCIPRLQVPVVADVDLEVARQACRLAGLADEQIVVCDSRRAALRAIERGQTAVLEDALLMMDLPVDVIVESTGMPEPGALHALAAIRHGKHVAMVNKETDATVGPILKYLADRQGVVYTAVDGDQHGLLMGLVAWTRELGLEVLCGGKFRGRINYDAGAGTVTSHGTPVLLDAAASATFGPVPPGQAAHFVKRRRDAIGDLGRPAGWDIVELVIAANATGLSPDADGFHWPVLRATEVPEVLCPVEEGGILQERGIIDVVTCLHHPDEVGLGGGVFVVVACANDYSRRVLAAKGLAFNSRGSAALIFRQHHLCGVETAISILAAALLGVPTGAADYLPRFDVIAQAAEDLKAGETVGDDHSPTLEALMRPARQVRAGAPLPLHMANGNRLAVDVPAGAAIMTEMVVPPLNSALWSLRAQQDELLLSAGPPDRRRPPALD